MQGSAETCSLYTCQNAVLVHTRTDGAVLTALGATVARSLVWLCRAQERVCARGVGGSGCGVRCTVTDGTLRNTHAGPKTSDGHVARPRRLVPAPALSTGVDGAFSTMRGRH